MRHGYLASTAVGLLMLAWPALAEIAISANDNKLVLVNGVGTVVKDPPPDTISIIDVKGGKAKLLTEIAVPASVVGPPLSVAIAPGEKLALVTAAMKINPADPTKQVADNKLSVIDLESNPPKVIATLETGASPAGLSINRQGTMALVANREEGSVSVFKIAGKQVTAAGKVAIADAKSGVSHPMFTPDGKTALVTRDGDSFISVLKIDGDQVTYTKRDMSAGQRPYGMDISSRGDFAVVANIGRGGGDSDTVSLIDMKAEPPRVVDTITVGQTPEGIKISPDGRTIGVVVMNGSNKAKESPFLSDHGKLVLLTVKGKKFVRLAEAKIGHWSQGVAFASDNKTILVGNMVEKNVQIFQLDDGKLANTGEIKVGGGSAAVRFADKPVKVKAD
ncbi:MAG: YncE family protein [Alphaproteobacteria bacterium]|nr:YncE family protein [Alphaproteobacteria bacterium]